MNARRAALLAELLLRGVDDAALPGRWAGTSPGDSAKQARNKASAKAPPKASERPRKPPQLRIALKAIRDATPAEREAALDSCLVEGWLVEGEGSVLICPRLS